jgi:hypothetical protein
MTILNQRFAQPPNYSFGTAIFMNWDRSIVDNQNMHAQY